MAEARAEADWNRTASLMALLANCHRDPKRQRAFSPDDFHPFAGRKKRRKRRIPKTRDLSILKAAFVKGK